MTTATHEAPPATELTGLELTAMPVGKRLKITARVGGEVVFVDTIDPASALQRTRFATALHERCNAVRTEAVEAELLKLATSSEDEQPTAPPQEVDLRRVARPELFHTPDASGLTVAVVLDAGGRLVARWRTYLRWSDGRREVIDAPERLTLFDGSILYFNPEPGEPPTEPPGWSARARSQWLSAAEPVNPARLFRDLCERFAYYLDFAPESAPGTTATLALWTMFSYLYPAWDAVPYLSVGGPVGSGKTRVLEVLQQLVFRPTKSENVTAPTLFRTLNAHGGVMLFDEAERLRQSTPDQQEILSVFLSGYKRGGCATRLEAVADKFRLVKFGVYGPKALACIAGLPPTLTSRCIPIMMFRSPSTSEKPKRRIDADPAGWQALRDDLHAFALERGGDLSRFVGQRDVVPAGITGRNYELWQPLLALAGWLQRSGAESLLPLMQQHAGVSVAGAKDDTVPEADELLLEVLAERTRSVNPPTSAELLEAVQRRDGVTFKAWSPNGVTRRLKTYGINTPKKVNGERRYRDVTPTQLREIQSRYGMELGFA